MVKDLIRSELKGVLLSHELLNLIIDSSFKLNIDECKIIDNLKSSRNRLIELGEQLKLKYFGSTDLPISVGNYSYAQLFIDCKLDPYCDIRIDEKLLLMELAHAVDVANTKFVELLDNKILAYIDEVVARSGMWLGVASKSSGVMGAVAYINRINFRVLSINGMNDGIKLELVEIGGHISVPGDVVHNLYLHSEMSEIIGVHRCGYHFDILDDLGAVVGENIAKIQVDMAQFFINHYLIKRAASGELTFNSIYWDELLLDYSRVKRSGVLQALALRSGINFRIWGLESSDDLIDHRGERTLERIELVSEFIGNKEQEWIDVLNRPGGNYSLLSKTPGVFNSKSLTGIMVENKETTTDDGFSLSNIGTSEANISDPSSKFDIGSVLAFKSLSSTQAQNNNPSIVGDFQISSGCDLSMINQDLSKLQSSVKTDHNGIFMAFAPKVFKEIGKNKFKDNPVELCDVENQLVKNKLLSEEQITADLLRNKRILANIIDKYDLAEAGEITAKKRLFLTIKKELQLQALLAAEQGFSFNLNESLAYVIEKINSSSTVEVKQLQQIYDYTQYFQNQDYATNLIKVSLEDNNSSNSVENFNKFFGFSTSEADLGTDGYQYDPEKIEIMGHIATAQWISDHTTIGKPNRNFDPGNTITESDVKIIISGNEMSKKTTAFDILRFGCSPISIGVTSFSKTQSEINAVELSATDGLNPNANVSNHFGLNLAQIRMKNFHFDFNALTCNSSISVNKLLSSINSSGSIECSLVDAIVTVPKSEILCAFNKCLEMEASASLKFGGKAKKTNVNVNSRVSTKSQFSMRIVNKKENKP